MFVCGLSHLRTDILARYNKHLGNVRNSPSMEEVVLGNIVARYVTTNLGANLNQLGAYKCVKCEKSLKDEK